VDEWMDGLIGWLLRGSARAVAIASFFRSKGVLCLSRACCPIPQLSVPLAAAAPLSPYGQPYTLVGAVRLLTSRRRASCQGGGILSQLARLLVTAGAPIVLLTD
jgi:hypothetical protein